MKKIENCKNDNFIPVPSSQITWDCGDVESLGICDGTPFCNVTWELIKKVQDLTINGLENFDIAGLASICSQQVLPLEITSLSIFNIIKANEICMMDNITTLSEQIAAISSASSVNVNLKCYATQDNLGNTLSITRDAFDQLVIDNLCNHKLRIEGLEGLVTSLQSQIDNIDVSPVVSEPSFATCINSSILTTSAQVINTSDALCDLIDAVGTPADVATSLALSPGDLNSEFGLISGWILSPANLAQYVGNMILEIENLRQRIAFMEENCCAASCDDIELGFSAVYNEDNTGIIIKFTSGAGTSIPSGFEDKGSTGTVTDIDGNVETFTIDIVDNFVNNNETEVLISGLNLTGKLTVDITAKIGNDGLTCEKCLHKDVNQAACAYCEVCAEGTDEDGSIVIIYESSKSSVVIENSSTTTSTSTTTTTTSLP